jgi:hypothetical protein
MKLIALGLSSFLFACSTPVENSGVVHDDIIGLISATNLGTSDQFDVVNLGPVFPDPGTANHCAGASLVVGSCCLFPPIQPVSDPPLGSGTVQTAMNAGTITLGDPTSNASGGAYPYQDQLYPSLPASWDSNLWRVGDVLTVTADGGAAHSAGGSIEAFTVSAPVLAAPDLELPSPIPLGKSVTVTWAPDPNATTMQVTLLDSERGGAVGCSVSDAQASVTIDARLLASSESGDEFQVAGSRETERSTPTSSGTIVFDSFGWTNILTTIQ